MWQIESAATRTVLLLMGAGIVADNWRTLLAMRKHARDAAAGVAGVSSWPL